MADTSITLPLLKLGRLQLDPGLRALQPGSAPSGLVVTATVPVPESSANRQYAWDVAWADAAREAGRLGADQATARALAGGAGDALVGGTRVVVAAHGEVLLARWLAPGAGAGSVQVGPLPHLKEAAAAAARRPVISCLPSCSLPTIVLAPSAIRIRTGRRRSITARGT